MICKCRGHVTSINFNGSDLTFTFKSITQFDSKKNEVDPNPGKFNMLGYVNTKKNVTLFRGIEENMLINVNFPVHSQFTNLLQLAYEQESAFEIKSIKVGRSNV